MFRDDIWWQLPAVVIALFQVFYLWRRLPRPNPAQIEIKGDYDDLDRFKTSYFINLISVIFLIQLTVEFVPITGNDILGFILRYLGLSLVVFGFIISYLAIKALGYNWAGLDDYQIKKDQILVTTGIYHYLRHPIYTAVILEATGFELLSNSWFFIPVLLFTGIFFYQHIKKEEALLEEGFGEEYTSYKEKSLGLLPFLN